MAVILDLDPGEAIRIGKDTVVRFIQKSGRRAKLRIETEYRVQHERVDDQVLTRPGTSQTSPIIRRPTNGNDN